MTLYECLKLDALPVVYMLYLIAFYYYHCYYFYGNFDVYIKFIAFFCGIYLAVTHVWQRGREGLEGFDN